LIHNSPHVKNKLAIKLAQYTVLLAFAIGFILSSIQVFEDYQEQGSHLDQTIVDILDASKPPATRAVHTLDQALAQEVVYGLMQYPFIHKVQIKDELGGVLAEQEAAVVASKTKWLTEAIAVKHKEYTLDLQAPEFAKIGPGRLLVVVDQDHALQPFFDRALTIFISGVVRNVLLAICLVFLFYTVVTKPLALLAKQFAELNLEKSEGKYLHVPKPHQDTELGQLSKAGNDFILTVQKLLSENKQHHLAMTQSEQLLNQLINQVPQLIVALNQKGHILFCNHQVAGFYDVTIPSIVGSSVSMFHRHSDEVEQLDLIRHSVERSAEPLDVNELLWSRPDGEQLYFSIQAAI
jgi:PAS domain-containing protein